VNDFIAMNKHGSNKHKCCVKSKINQQNVMRPLLHGTADGKHLEIRSTCCYGTYFKSWRSR
jgi:hypothetical protein